MIPSGTELTFILHFSSSVWNRIIHPIASQILSLILFSNSVVNLWPFASSVYQHASERWKVYYCLLGSGSLRVSCPGRSHCYWFSKCECYIMLTCEGEERRYMFSRTVMLIGIESRHTTLARSRMDTYMRDQSVPPHLPLGGHRK